MVDYDYEGINLLKPTRKMFYTKLEKNKYKCLCSQCGNSWKCDSKEMNAIKHLHICTKCKSRIESTVNKEYKFQTPFLDQQEWNLYGKYKGYIALGRVVNAEMIVDDIVHVLKEEEGKRGSRNFFIKNCKISSCFGYYTAFYSDGRYNVSHLEWTKRKPKAGYYGNGYLSAFWESLEFAVPVTAKQQLMYALGQYKDYPIEDININVKSNQRYMMQHNLFTQEMMIALLMFDVTHYDTLYKYAKEIQNIVRRYDFEMQFKMREYDLIYLCENKINYGDYLDYLRQCKQLGIVDKHPKDFNKAHANLSDIIAKMKDEEKIKKANDKIKMFDYPATKIKNIEIQPYRDAETIKEDATEFHICIFSNYLDRYADGKTLIYRATIDNKLIACIELNENTKTVVQIRGAYNARVEEHDLIEKACLKMMKVQDIPCLQLN